MDHLGIQKFFFMVHCIGGPFALKLMERALTDRVVAAVLCQPVGHRPGNPDVIYKSGKDVWAPELLARRPDPEYDNGRQIPARPLPRSGPTSCMSRDFAQSCQTPMLVMPDDAPAHPYQTSVDIALAGAERRGNGLLMARPPGAEGTDDQPSAHLPKGASTHDREPLSRELRRVANLGSAGDRTLSCVFVSKSSVSCARANWLEVWLTMRPHFTARPLSEITPIVRPEALQISFDPV